MTNERDMNDVDELVSATYRELADERAPEHLNRAVLQLAAGSSAATRGGTGWISAWMKPVAWAATIALSLAIFLEFTELPTGVSRQDAIAPAAEPVLREVAPAAVSDLNEKVNGPDIDPVTAAAPGASLPAARKQMLQEETVGSAEARSRLSDDTNRPARSSNFLAEEMAATPLSADAVSLQKKEADTAADCDSTARLTAASWLACIKELRAAGDNEAAEREQKVFAREFPAEFAEFEANK
jgi:hypothetical protein